ncbi:MAG: leucine-rich repeat protein [Bacteroidales bacterium]|nr:leucine-rich repeat protein [Bacteroidales bacterium]
MKYRILSISLAAAMFAACSVNSEVIDNPENNVVEEFFATIEDESTRVFADDQLRVLWNADDRVSIFNKNTFNYEYKFTGEDGDNSGSFKKVPNEEFVTGNQLDYAYSVYPYQESTKISNDGAITVTLPAEQTFKANSFGKGANTMIAVTQSDELMFKNLCGYLSVKLYGDNVTVSSITIKGNNNEPLAGKATVNASIDGAPSLSFDSSATKEIKLTFETPVTLGTSPETATTFWFVIPPTSFSKGFTLSVKDNKNGFFEKSTTKSFEISRNTLSKMTELKAIPEISNEAIVFADENVKAKLVAAFDTNGDSELSYAEAAAVTSGDDLKNAFGAIKTYKSFSEFQYFINIESIPESFFSSWNLLECLTIPASVKYIGAYAFKDCVKITEITLPNRLKGLGYGVFAGCSSLKSILIPDSISGTLGIDINLEHDSPSRFHGDGMFEGCSSLEEVVLSKNITSLGVYTFYGCHELNNLVIPSTIVRFNIGTFEGCSKLPSITIPESMTIIPKSLFNGCSSLLSITIPDNITKIGAFAFHGCNSISSITIPDRVTDIGEGAFGGCSQLSSFDIPESVSTIEASSFAGCEGLISISIPHSIVSIGKSAFSSCRSLQTIIIPNSVTRIDSEAFAYCGLQSIIIPESVTTIGQRVFRNCSNLTSVALPNTELHLNQTFLDCDALNEITIPSKTGLYHAFENCNSLKTVVFEDGREIIESNAFINCPALESVSLPETIISIGNFAFTGTALRDIRIPSKVERIESYAFASTALERITIPSNVLKVGKHAFSSCSKLQSANIMGAISTIEEGVFMHCSRLTEVILPESVTSIENQAFFGSAIESILLPNQLNSIGKQSFAACAYLSHLSIPENVGLIGEEAFASSTGLKSIILNPQTPPTAGANLFYKNDRITIYVPATAIEAYKTAENWSRYESSIEAIPE